MIYVLFAILVVLFMLSYYFSGRDFFTPSTVQILTFAGATFMCIYFMWSLDCPHDFQWKTIGLIACTMAMSVVVGIIVHRVFLRVDITPYSSDSMDISPVSITVSIITLGVILFTILWLLAEIRRIGGTSSSFWGSMHNFRNLYSYSAEEDARLPWVLNQLLSLNRVMFILYGFNYLRFRSNISAYQKIINIVILGFSCATMLLTGERTPVINNIIALVIIFHLLRIQKQNGYKQYSFKFFFKIIFLILLVMVVFFFTKTLVGRTGRNNAMNPADYIAYYVGSGLIVFDQYITHPLAPSNIFGKFTFRNIIVFLTNYGIIDIPRYIGHLEFRPVGAGFTNNVYTFLRVYHYDFGVVGTFVLHGLMILFLSIFYEYVKKKRGNIGILIFSMMYYSIVMSFFTERFFSQVFSLNFIKLVVLLLILYELFIRKRIRLKFRRTAYALSPIPIQRESHTIDS